MVQNRALLVQPKYYEVRLCVRVRQPLCASDSRGEADTTLASTDIQRVIDFARGAFSSVDTSRSVKVVRQPIDASIG